MNRIFASILLISLFVFVNSCKKEKSSSPQIEYQVGKYYSKRGFQPGIFDHQGRRIILRGANYNVLGDYWQGNVNAPATAQHDIEQFKIMSSYGFNCIRLLFNWSQLEPERGKYNQDYIQKISQTIRDAEKYGIDVILDLHQDAYSRFIFSTADDNCPYPQKGWDGAPQWACLTDGASVCSQTGTRESTPAVFHAWQNLWDNKDGIQDALITAWIFLIKELGEHENLIAYDLINEPSLGYKNLDDQHQKLSNFYSKLITQIRQTELNSGLKIKMVFFEPAVTFNGQEIPSVSGANFTYDKNIVFAPHNYFEVISNILTIEQGFSLYKGLADSYQTPCFIGEWGVYSEPSVAVEKVKRFAQQEDKYLMGSTYWQWAQAPGDPHGVEWNGNYEDKSLHLMELNALGQYTGVRNDIFLKVLSRTRPIAIHGKQAKFSSDTNTGRFQLTAEAETEGETEVWIPDWIGKPVIGGSNFEMILLNKVEGGYVATFKVYGKYEIRIES
ncbi:MAG: glycoside hydrolase family 5 protein [Chitinophagales bacterium]|nr:glycoside hydrolase family 5 protein [Chitinophagales bacterium]